VPFKKQFSFFAKDMVEDSRRIAPPSRHGDATSLHSRRRLWTCQGCATASQTRLHMHTEKIGPLTAHLTGGDDGHGGGDGPVVVLLHGFGAPGTDLIGLADELKVPPGTRFVFPEAPLEVDVGQPGLPGRAWWQIDMLRLQMALHTGATESMAKQVPEGLDAARGKLLEFLNELDQKLSIADAPLVLGGFSQGAMLSTDLVLRTNRHVSGLMVLSGTLIAQQVWLELYAKRAGMRFFQSHGNQDPILPLALAERLYENLSRAGWKGRFVTFQGGHGIGLEAVSGASEFLLEVLVVTNAG
jgi:phospholipase/carboxylesterase